MMKVLTMEKRLRDVNWDDYQISKNRYKELKAFCMQYNEKKSKIKSMQQSIMKNPAQNSQESALYVRDIRMIEEAAVRANPEIWRYIIKSVTQNLPYEYIEYDEEQGRIPMGKTDFNANRRYFYHILDEMQRHRNHCQDCGK
jgi:hypothetical protein